MRTPKRRLSEPAALGALRGLGWCWRGEGVSVERHRHIRYDVLITVAGKLSDTMPVGQLTDIKRNSEIEELR